MTDPASTSRPALNEPAILAATWFGTGYLPKAPGTWGTLGALPFAWVIQSVSGWLGLLVCAVVVTGLGLWASKIYMERTGSHDPGAIVIDEVAGMWITLLPLAAGAPDPLAYGAAFALFRALDVLKPWPISLFDQKIGGAPGVMADDIAAGIFGAVVLHFLWQWVGG